MSTNTLKRKSTKNFSLYHILSCQSLLTSVFGTFISALKHVHMKHIFFSYLNENKKKSWNRTNTFTVFRYNCKDHKFPKKRFSSYLSLRVASSFFISFQNIFYLKYHHHLIIIITTTVQALVMLKNYKWHLSFFMV